MTDLQAAQRALKGHTIALCKGDALLISDLKGISPMMGFIEEGRDLSGWSAADTIVGKAAAFLFVYAGISEVYAEVLSEEGAKVLNAHGIPFICGKKVPYIINRRGDDICPMEKAVLPLTDPAQALEALKAKLKELRSSARNSK